MKENPCTHCIIKAECRSMCNARRDWGTQRIGHSLNGNWPSLDDFRTADELDDGTVLEEA